MHHTNISIIFCLTCIKVNTNKQTRIGERSLKRILDRELEFTDERLGSQFNFIRE